MLARTEQLEAARLVGMQMPEAARIADEPVEPFIMEDMRHAIDGRAHVAFDAGTDRQGGTKGSEAIFRNTRAVQPAMSEA